MFLEASIFQTGNWFVFLIQEEGFTVTEKAANQPNPVVKYFREVRGELRKVTWPTPAESRRLTTIVVAVSLAFAIFLWLWDTIFSRIVQLLIEQIV
ncbi:MAG: preprotein translocase subunit SecE [Anaerolineae bacterium]|nr:preprotein translocase subunit SecE [Anaerolineae bacterium]